MTNNYFIDKHQWRFSPSYIILSFLIALSFFTSASPFLVPVLYISPSLEKDVVFNINK